MMFSTGQTIPYLPRRGEHRPNPNAHNPVTTTVRTEHVLFEKQSRQVKRSSQMHRGWGPLLTWHSPDFFFRCDEMPVFGAVFLADSNLEKKTCFFGGTNLLVPALVPGRRAWKFSWTRRSWAQPKFSRRSCGHILRCDRRL